MQTLTPTRSRVGDTRAGGRGIALPALAVLLLVATLLVPVLAGNAALVGGLGFGLGLVIVAILTIAHQGAGLVTRLGAGSPRAVGRASLEMVLHLSPVALLTFVFPLAVARMGDAEVGDVALPTLLLASSLTVPWLSMAVCLPLYRAIGHLMSAGDLPGVRARLVEVWAPTLLQSLPVMGLFAVLVQAVMQWSVAALAGYVALCVLHVAFAQSLVVANVERNRLLWASAWLAYALALIVAPLAWFLPPILGLLTQLFPLRAELARLRRVVRLEHVDVAKDLGRGLVLGSVLWGHLLFFYLASRGQFAVVAVFIAVLPAVLAYNYYFVRLAPRFDEGVLRLRSAMEREPHHALAVHSERLAFTVTTSVARTAFVGAALGFVITVAIASITGMSVALVATVSVASWLLLMTTVACYKLDYVGQVAEAQLLSGAHLAAAAIAFLALPPGIPAYAGLIAADLVILTVAIQRCLSHWRSSEYALFWRHATAW